MRCRQWSIGISSKSYDVKETYIIDVVYIEWSIFNFYYRCFDDNTWCVDCDRTANQKKITLCGRQILKNFSQSKTLKISILEILKSHFVKCKALLHVSTVIFE